MFDYLRFKSFFYETRSIYQDFILFHSVDPGAIKGHIDFFIHFTALFLGGVGAKIIKKDKKMG